MTSIFRVQLDISASDGHITDTIEGSDPAVVAAWLRAQADRIAPPRRSMRSDQIEALKRGGGGSRG